MKSQHAAKRILLIYHFFYPNTVISARLFFDLAEYLHRRKYDVTVFSCNRLMREPDVLPESEMWNGVCIRRFSRPNFSQGNTIGRVLNSLILQVKWLVSFWRNRKEYDAVIVGTDPQFCYWMFPLMKRINPEIRLIHWVFDVFPEAAMIDSSLWLKIPASILKLLVPFCYKAADDVVDIGPCMHKILDKYHHSDVHTLTPWALVEPEEIPHPDADIRKELFGDAKIGLLYSGTVGYAHDITPFIKLARECRKCGIDATFCFAGYGNCYWEQTKQITAEDTNIRLAGFVSEENLEVRLAAADIHLISLRPGWEGVVVPSKFFGALSIGRPVIFSGSEESEIARWCRAYSVGTILSDDTLEYLRNYMKSEDRKKEVQKQVMQCYREHFSKNVVLSKWKELLG